MALIQAEPLPAVFFLPFSFTDCPQSPQHPAQSQELELNKYLSGKGWIHVWAGKGAGGDEALARPWPLTLPSTSGEEDLLHDR